MGAKKNKLLFVLLFCATTVCHAQFRQISMKQGLLVGKAQLSGNVPEAVKEQNKLVANWSIGLATEYNFNKTLAVAVECLYSTKGTRIVWDYNREEGSRHVVRMQYLEVPVLLKLFLLNRGIRIFLEAGPSAGFALLSNETDKWKHNDGDYENTEEVSIRNIPGENPDYALNAGFGFLSMKGRFLFGAGQRYIHSISNGVYALTTYELTKEKSRFKGKNRQGCIYFTLAYVFNPDKKNAIK